MKYLAKCKFFLLCSYLLMCSLLLPGCSIKQEKGVKIQDLDFTVLSMDTIPEELKEMIAPKQKEAFSFSLRDGDDLFLCIGYGEQKTGGFSIAINELYMTENSIVVDSTLLGPTLKEAKGTAPSYPFLVLRTQAPDLEVIFE